MLHACIIDRNEPLDIYAGNTLLNMFARCGSLEDAQRVFDRLPAHDIVSMNVLLMGYAENGKEKLALELFTAVHLEANARTLMAALKACSSLALKEEGRKVDGKLLKVEALQRGSSIHAHVVNNRCEGDVILMNTVVDMYAKCGSMLESRRVFDEMPYHDTVSWNVLLLGYADNGDGESALELFSRMGSAPNWLTFVAALKACSALAAKENGREVNGQLVRTESLEKTMTVHARAVECICDSDILVSSGLINAYAKSGSTADARGVFDRMAYHDLVSWNVLLLGYVENGEEKLALDLLACMKLKGCSITCVAALKACTALAVKEEAKPLDGKMLKLQSLEQGKALHAANKRYESELFVSATLLNMYAKCGIMTDARSIFDQMPWRSLVSCNALMLGYVESKDAESALEVFSRMLLEEWCTPDALSFIAALKACGTIMALEVVKAIHREVEGRGLDISDVANCLVDAYGKCGSPMDAQEFFDSLPVRDAVTWTALMTGYSRQGDAEQVIELFQMMAEEDLPADGVTFNCVLNACAHAGLVDKGREIFQAMSSPRCGQITPDLEHYTCLVDMLGRANELDEALEVVRTMPYQPNAFTWTTLLSSCRKWKNVEIGRLAFESLLRLEDEESAPYILMSGLYRATGMWEEQLKVESMRKDKQAWKKLGQSSWTDPTGLVHLFTVGDRNHPQSQEIYSRLEQIMKSVKEQEGHVASSVTHNISEVEKEDTLCGHSEKLAIVYALLNTAPGTSIRIMKNLRSCEDCHRVAAIISKVERRKIVCRDANRFHVFRDGRCSCGDFW